jgi:hypothetical protein
MRSSLAVLLIAQQATAFLAPRHSLPTQRSLHLAGKALTGFADAPPPNDALSSVGFNVVATGIAAAIAWNYYQQFDADQKCIAKVDALANLRVMTALALAGLPAEGQTTRLRDYRRKSRVMMCAGGAEYITALAIELGADKGPPGRRTGPLSAAVQTVDLIVVPVLLDSPEAVADARPAWREVAPPGDRADAVVAFPQGSRAWADYLADEFATARSQNIDPVAKGFTITFNKDGKILRRASGLPLWDAIIGTLEVLDGTTPGRCCDGRCTGACRLQD